MKNLELPVLPETAPFSAEQRAYLNGFIAGLFSRGTASPSQQPPPNVPGQTRGTLTILFGSQTGTAEKLAKKFGKSAASGGWETKTRDMAQLKLAELTNQTHVIIITSTYGDGEPPDNARALLNELQKSNEPLNGVLFAVCALGDRNYEKFCQCGKDFDSRLAALGAKQLLPLVECDVDYDVPFQKWTTEILALLNGSSVVGSNAALAAHTPSTSEANQVLVTEKVDSGYSRKNPFCAPLLERKRLNASGSAKETRHYSFSLAGSEIHYEVGDAIGVWPQNCPKLVNALLEDLGCGGEETVTIDGVATPLRCALQDQLEITRITPALVEQVARGNGETEFLARFVDNPKALQDYVHGRDLFDLLNDFPQHQLTPSDLVSALRKLQPRLYSISSSQKAFPDEVHLTVGTAEYETHGRVRRGVCSNYLANGVPEHGGSVRLFLHRNTAFRLPQDPNASIIMVGPGTGIAPFRAFLQERAATAAPGGNWLFFGDQKKDCDFLYREEMEAWSINGVLHHLTTAFSRDQAEKIYVQHRMLEHSQQLFRWLEEGAYFYVCGDAARMARDVESTLLEVIRKEGNLDHERAEAYLDRLRAQKRYLRDVY
jgi:sulfite reductase (NADPH) flavoprotein alpha-component